MHLLNKGQVQGQSLRVEKSSQQRLQLWH